MKNLLIIGAGSAGEILSKELIKKKEKNNYNIVGFLDRDENKYGKIINGYKVFGSYEKNI